MKREALRSRINDQVRRRFLADITPDVTTGELAAIISAIPSLGAVRLDELLASAWKPDTGPARLEVEVDLEAMSYREIHRELDRELLPRAMKQAGSIFHAAAMLGLSRDTLRKKINALREPEPVDPR